MKDVIVRVPTQEDWINVANVAFSKGYIWIRGDKDIGADNWYDYKEKSCINIINERMGYCDEWSYKNIYPKIPIISTQEYLREDFLIKYNADMADSVIEYDFYAFRNSINITGSDETISQPNKKMNKLKPMMKRLLDKDTRTLYKAGYINGDLELTENGRNALDTIIFTANKAELVKMAQEELDEEE